MAQSSEGSGDRDTVAGLIERLGLQPHPEGGWWAQTWLGGPGPGQRPLGTAIVYLLAPGADAAWHRVDVDEVWHFHAGAPVELRIGEPATGGRPVLLGPDVLAGQAVQHVVPAREWQAAATTGAWSLVGCTMAPGFSEATFELVAPDGTLGPR